jgi:glycosyltransferase involved in cell wall biosynthesis
MSKISAYIIAYNEAEKIRAAIESTSWADEVLVVDSHSTDGTTEIAQSMGARVVQVPFVGFGDLRNQAIAACTYDWIFSLDADERCTDEVRDEILNIVQSDDSSDVYYVPRKNFFMGRWIKHSGYYPDYRQPQLFRKGTLEYKPDPVHEGFELKTSTPPGYLKSAIWQVPFRNLEEILHKANRYSSLGASKLEAEGRPSGMPTALFHGLWAFIQHFFVKRGFLDGWAGFVIALGNFEGTFYKYAKLHERTANWELSDPE